MEELVEELEYVYTHLRSANSPHYAISSKIFVYVKELYIHIYALFWRAY